MFTGYFAVLLVLLSLATAQPAPIDPIFDCTNPNFQVIYTACRAKDYQHCCAVGTDCCAGGCCPLLASCVGVGTSQETCCGFEDPTNCGTGPNLPQPSVVCEGANGLSSYKCPPGSTCDMFNDTCYLPSSAAGQSSQAVQTSTAQPCVAPTVTVTVTVMVTSVP